MNIMGKLQQFMYGRNGFDSLGRFLSVLVIIIMIFGTRLIPKLSTLAFLLIAICLFRALSRNLYKREQENTGYLALKHKITSSLFKNKKHKTASVTKAQYFCPSCQQALSIPIGLGTVEITCPRCHTVFKQRS